MFLVRFKAAALVVMTLLIGVTARAELTLVAEFNGRTLPVAGADRDHIFCANGDKKTSAPEEAKWRIEGDLKGNVALVRWSPVFGVTLVERPDAEVARMERPWRGTVALLHATELYGKKHESPLLADWPAGVRESGIVVFAWIVDGRVVQAAAQPLASTQRSQFFSHGHAFELTKSEAAGQGAVLLWIDGKFQAPEPWYKDPAALQAAHAIALGDGAGLRAALQAGAKPRATSRQGMPLLVFAAEIGNLEAVEALLAAGAKASERGKALGSPLCAASANGRLAVVERLIAAKADLDAKDPNEGMPLLSALNGRHEAVALRLVAAGANMDARAEGQHIPLTLAIEQGMAETARAILARKDHFDFKNEQVPRVLITQAKLGHTGMVRLLLERHVRADVEYQGATALMAAAKGGDAELARTLLAAGVAVDQATGAGGTALMSAASSGNPAFTRALIEAGARPGLAQKDGRTALHHAVYSRNLDVVGLLLAAGANANARDARGRSPLDIALVSHFREAAVALAARGAKIDLKQPLAPALLRQAVVLDLASVVQAALSDGWSAEADLEAGWPALRIAEVCRSAAVAEVLRAAGARPTADAAPLVELGGLDARPKLKAVRTPVDPRDIDDVFPAETVDVELVIDPNGLVQFQRLRSSPTPMLGLAVLDAVGDWKFTPPLKSGQPAVTKFVLPVEFPSSKDRARATGDVDVLPVPVKQVSPVFPPMQRRNGRVGEVRLRFVVNTEGRTEHIRVVSSPHPDFEEAAVKAFSQWIFKPGLRDGQPVNVRMEIPIIFTM